MISTALKYYSKLVLKNRRPEKNVLVFTPTIGKSLCLGNVMWMLPMFKALENRNLTIVCDNEELKTLLEYNIDCKVYPVDKLNGEYSTSINNFLTQTTQFAKKVISLRIPCRIGHLWPDRRKYSWLFNYKYYTNDEVQEESSNSFLLEPFNLRPVSFKLILPPTTHRISNPFDVIIQPHSHGNTARDWAGYESVMKSIKGKIGIIGNSIESKFCQSLADRTGAENLCGISIIETARIMENALVIGNEAGLVKLAYAMGCRVIQITKSNSVCAARSWIPSGTLFNPSIKDVIKEVEELTK